MISEDNLRIFAGILSNPVDLLALNLQIINAKYANGRNYAFKIAVVGTNRLKSRQFTAFLKFNKGISTIQGICFTFKRHNDRTNENKLRIFVFTVHETLVISTYQKRLPISRHVLLCPEIAASWPEMSDMR